MMFRSTNLSCVSTKVKTPKVNRSFSTTSSLKFPQKVQVNSSLAGSSKSYHERNSTYSATTGFSGASRWAFTAFGVGVMTLGAVIYSEQTQESNADEKKEEQSALDAGKWKKFALMQVIPVNHNTKIFRFKLDNPNQSLGMPVSSCILVKGQNDDQGKPVVRPYTPITFDEKGYFDLMIKAYPNGPVSSYIHSLHPGDSLEVKGPFPTLAYKPNMKKRIGMVAGGTGITPMLQVIHEVLKNPNDTTEVSLIFANITDKDILLKERLDGLAKKHKNFKVYYVLEKPPADWKQGVGYVSADMIKNLMPAPSKDNLVMVCGPAPMVNFLSGPKTPDYQQGELKGLLKNLGYSEDNVWKY